MSDPINQTEVADGQSRLTDVLGATPSADGVIISDSERYRRLVDYMIGPRTDLDDAFVAAGTKDAFDRILDSYCGDAISA